MNIQIGMQIKALRKAQGITQEAVAEFVGVSCQAVSKWETGATLPDVTLLPSLAALFGVRIDDLFRVDHEDELERVRQILYHENLTERNFAYAERILEGLLAEDEKNTGALKYYAELLLKRAHSDGLHARRMVERVLMLVPEEEDAVLLYRRLCPGGREETRSGNKDFLRMCGEHTTTQKAMERIVEAMIDVGDTNGAEEVMGKLESVSMQNIFRGEILLSLGDRAGAMALWNSISPSDHKGQYEAGERFRSIGETEAAIRCYQNSFAAAESPRDLSAVYALAFLYREMGMLEETARAWETILDVLEKEYGITDGSAVDWAQRELDGLKKEIR